MKIKKICCNSFAASLVILLALSGCKQEDLYQGNKKGEVNDFSFATTTSPTVNIQYADLGFEGKSAPVFFELYTENPLTTDEEGFTSKKSGLQPLFAGFTAKDATWSNKVEIPATATTLYAYSPSILATTLISTEVNEDATNINMVDVASRTASATRATPRTGLYTTGVSENGWKTWLGRYSSTGMDESANDYNALSGGMEYADIFYNEADKNSLSISKELAADLLSRHQEVIDISKSCPEQYRTSSDLLVKEDASVALAHLGSNTCWSNSIAYYYYPDGQQPTSREQIHPILIIPNTQDGHYSKGGSKTNAIANNAKGIERGTNIQLYFYGYGDDFNENNKQRVFPAGTRIGLILKSHAWNEGNTPSCKSAVTGKQVSPNLDTNETIEHFSSTTPKLNTKLKFTTGSGAAMYTPDGDHVVISFEDHFNDENYSDLAVLLTSNPLKAITDVTSATDSEIKTTIKKGLYAFEDLWPEEGDYDMNDVLVEASQTKTTARDYTTTTNSEGGTVVSKSVVSSNSYLKGESFIFKVDQNYATLKNGLAFRIGSSASFDMSKIENVWFTIDGTPTPFDYDYDDGTFYLTDNVKNVIGKVLELHVAYKHEKYSPENNSYSGSYIPASEQSTIYPFIFRSEGEKNWEVHIPYEAPSVKMNTSYFGTKSDQTDVNKKTFFVRSGNYPFAFFLSGATLESMASLLKKENESKRIDEIYPGFLEWAQSKGKKNKNWYVVSE